MTGTLRMKPLVVSLLAGAAFAFGGSAFAQTGQAPTVREYQRPQAEPPQPTPPRRTRPMREGVTGFGQTQDVLTYPRFIVEAVNFHAVDESGPNSPGADEVFAIFQGPNYIVITNEVGSVETGDIEPFVAGQTCIWPAIDPDNRTNHQWACDPQGGRGPVRFGIRLFEDDESSLSFSRPCLRGGPNDVITERTGCETDNADVLFNADFTYEVADILARLDPSCRCLVQTARYTEEDWRGDMEYQVTFRITRVDDGREQPGVDRNPDSGGGIPTPVVHRSGTLSAVLDQDLEFDAGTVVASGGDFDFARISGSLFLTPQSARIWTGGATARGFATCYAERGSANYVTTRVALPAVGSYACYITSDGRVGEFRVDSVAPTPLGGSVRLGVTYTTWQ